MKMGNNTFDVDNIVRFMSLVGRLKHLKRKGWELRNVKEPETVAGHMYRMAMMSFLVNSKELDRTKVMQMTLVHDLAESIVGDITPECGISAEQKHKMEDEAMQQICNLLGEETGAEMLQLFREYEKRESAEARYVKDLDRLDLLMQTYEYERRDQTPGQHQLFVDGINGKIHDPFVKMIADKINHMRDNNSEDN